MSKFYGQWYDESEGSSDEESLKNKYLRRLSYFTSLADETVYDIIEKHPKLNEKLFVCYQNIEIALGRYFNDIARFKYLHDIKVVHPSKMLAHAIKWAHLNPILFSSIQKKDFHALPILEQTISININYSFIMQYVEYTIRQYNKNISETKYNNIFYNLQYHLKTGTYHERMARLWFKELING